MTRISSGAPSTPIQHQPPVHSTSRNAIHPVAQPGSAVVHYHAGRRESEEEQVHLPQSLTSPEPPRYPYDSPSATVLEPPSAGQLGIQWNLQIMDTLGTGICQLFRGCPFFGGRNVWTIYRQGANSVSIVGRLSTLQSVHYQRFHCTKSSPRSGRNYMGSFHSQHGI